MSELVHLNEISEIHRLLGLGKPKHPLVSLFPIQQELLEHDFSDATYVMGFYKISLKAGPCGELTYGRNTYDFKEGAMVFSKPGQVLTFKNNGEQWAEGGWTLLFHPDLIRKSDLSKSIDSYSFFNYDVHEALHVSDDEKAILTELGQKIVQEYNQNIDRHTQRLIIANITLILDYCTRYYDRQFYVRTNLNQDLVSRFESLLNHYFDSQQALDGGLPTVKYCSEQLNLSASYLSDLLKKETGRTAQQHIQLFVVERIKNRLLASSEQISQIAYDLGFEYPQHLSKMFKKRTGMSPAEYRRVH